MFLTEVNGTSCTCNVLSYQESQPMLVTGMGFGDCIPPEPEEFEFELLDSKGNELSEDVSSSDIDRLIKEYKATRMWV